MFLASTMPKTGLSAFEWKKRLQQYAQGTFSFGRGQKPNEGTHWKKELAKIDRCPKHANIGSHDPFGKKIVCVCGYHREPEKPPTTEVSVME